jgi:Zn-dependent metalloprotease
LRSACTVLQPGTIAGADSIHEPGGTGRARSHRDHRRRFAHGKRARKGRHVYDAHQQFELPGQLVRGEDQPRTTEVDVDEAWDGSGATYEFFKCVFGRRSIDGHGMPIDSTVHYGTRFDNAMWNGRQMVYGDGGAGLHPLHFRPRRHRPRADARRHRARRRPRLHRPDALNEHVSDAFGIMVRQYKLGQSASESDWLIGAGLFGPSVNGSAIRSMALPGTAYHDPILGRDPQPSHMRDYVHTAADNGGVHVNSGILNHAFYLAAMTLGGKTWEVLGRIWYAALTDRLKPDAEFADFTRATVDIAGELYGNGGSVQRIVADAWAEVGLPVALHVCSAAHDSASPRFRIAKWRPRP